MLFVSTNHPQYVGTTSNIIVLIVVLLILSEGSVTLLLFDKRFLKKVNIGRRLNALTPSPVR